VYPSFRPAIGFLVLSLFLTGCKKNISVNTFAARSARVYKKVKDHYATERQLIAFYASDKKTQKKNLKKYIFCKQEQEKRNRSKIVSWFKHSNDIWPLCSYNIKIDRHIIQLQQEKIHIVRMQMNESSRNDLLAGVDSLLNFLVSLKERVTLYKDYRTELQQQSVTQSIGTKITNFLSGSITKIWS
jgi:hypothetical protein